MVRYTANLFDATLLRRASNDARLHLDFNMMKQTIIFFLSGMILVATLFIPKEVHTQEEMKSLVLGYPIGFYAQDFSRFTPLEFPQRFNFGSPWEDPAYILWDSFVLSHLIVFAGLNAMLFAWRKMQRSIGRIEP